MFPEGFRWGVASSGHQTEGGNTRSDTWFLEHVRPTVFREPSGSACRSYQRWREDVDLVAGLGLDTYRFSVEWARVEPAEGQFSASVRDRKRAEVYDRWLALARDDDFVGVQNYERARYDADGSVSPPPDAALNQMGSEDVVTADGELVQADAEQNPDLLWAARGAGPGFPGVVTRFRLQTYPAPRAMWHDTWTFRLDDTVELLTWLHDVLPGLGRHVEPVVAATRLPDVPLHDGTMRPDGTVLLLHTTVMADSDAEALARLAPLQDGPLAGRELGHVRDRTSVTEENLAQTAQNPEGYRYAVDCTWTDAPARILAPMLHELWSELDTEHSFSIWYGWAPRRDLPDMAFSVEADVYVATYAIYADPADDARYQEWVHRRTAALAVHGAGVYLGDTDFTRRQDRFLSDDAYRRLAAIRAGRDPSGRFASYLTSEPAGLNAHG